MSEVPGHVSRHGPLGVEQVCSRNECCGNKLSIKVGNNTKQLVSEFTFIQDNDSKKKTKNQI